MRTFLIILDLAGTFVFALSGATVGVRQRLDLFGVLGLSIAAATAGGIVRDVLIGAIPPAALLDWNNNYADDDEKCVLFHCGNWAKSFLPDIEISTAPILGTSVGEENTYGALSGRTPASALTYGRLSTDDSKGVIKAYVGEGMLTDDDLKTFGNKAVAKIPNLQGLMQYVCKNGFEHHVVMNASKTADILKEAFENYMGWEVYHHGKSEVGS